jgi:hypothetical protein
MRRLFAAVTLGAFLLSCGSVFAHDDVLWSWGYRDSFHYGYPSYSGYTGPHYYAGNYHHWGDVHDSYYWSHGDCCHDGWGWGGPVFSFGIGFGWSDCCW